MRKPWSHPRLYLGIAAQGRSLKVVMLRTYLALLGAGQIAYDADGGKRNKEKVQLGGVRPSFKLA